MAEFDSLKEGTGYSRAHVIDAFKLFSDQGFTNPDDLPEDNPAVRAAHDILNLWTQEACLHATQSSALDALLTFSLSRGTVLVDAGFNHPEHLDEVANDWLTYDLLLAKEAGLTEMVMLIRAKINEINPHINYYTER